jgi:hypothetical protein
MQGALSPSVFLSLYLSLGFGDLYYCYTRKFARECLFDKIKIREIIQLEEKFARYKFRKIYYGMYRYRSLIYQTFLNYKKLYYE